MKRFTCLLTALLAVALIASVPAQAENRALMIGIGVYANPNANLPGIDLDLNNMRQALTKMGYKPSQIRTVKDSQATLAGIRQAIKDWLINGVGPGDEAVFYYTGHGSQVPDTNGDEADKADECLVPHDVQVDRANRTLKNVLIDDEFGRYLAQIRADRLLVFVDACHSGSATKAMGLDEDGYMEKFFYYEGMPQFLAKGMTAKADFTSESAGASNYVALSAARDDEKAIATKRGSLFTLATQQSIDSAAQAAQKGITMDQLRVGATNYIKQTIKNPRKVHHPVLSGNTALAGKMIALRGVGGSPPPPPPPTTNPGGGGGGGQQPPAWQELENLVGQATNPISVRANKSVYAEGEIMTISCRVDRAGYLNILTLGPGDTVPTVLFPNKYHRNNQVSPGSTITIPAAGDKFKLRVRRPLGKSLVVVFHTKERINAYEDAGGSAKGLFVTLSDKSARSIAVEGDKSGNYFGAGKFVVTAR